MAQPPPHTPQPFYGPFSQTTRASRCQKTTSGLYGAKEDYRGRHTDHPARCHSIRTNQCPPPPSLHILRAGCPSCHPTNSVKALKATSAFGLGRRRWSSPQRCYLHRLRHNTTVITLQQLLTADILAVTVLLTLFRQHLF